ncbi:hypothetical protein BS47DRAFT_1366112 [Hydnum rufescens UP504]|uniref:Uncharacterized protein n=1 Tax=Hydnum rufescens UP504 TaxID=1448309 RepID=A0A9P6ANU2_9AGAM|nr:hypothetical protein BS47DRAFT_1366112 [Hydnum rufescens UP504]
MAIAPGSPLESTGLIFRHLRIPDPHPYGEMRGATQSSQTWLQHLVSCFRPHRGTAQGTGETAIVGPISTGAIASAESALRWISNVPGGHTAQVRIGVVLDIIKGLNVSQVLMLSRELETVSSKMAPAASSNEAPRRRFFIESDVRNVAEIHPISRNALPLYPISPIEAALLPRGVISKSSCALSPFIKWILKYERMMEYRIGAVRTLEHYTRGNLTFEETLWR